MARLRFNDIGSGIGGATTVTLTNGGTTITFNGSAPPFPTIASPDYAPIILETDTANEEVIWLTAYTASASTGTVTRNSEPTKGGQNSSAAHTAVAWAHGPTAYDFSVTQTTKVQAATAPTPGHNFNNVAVVAGIPQLTAGSSVIDGVTVQAGPVLLNDQSTASQNGIWQVPSSGANCTRPDSFPTGFPIFSKDVEVAAGANLGGTMWSLSTTTSGITVDTSSQSWVLSYQTPTANQTSSTTTATLAPGSVNIFTGTGAVIWNLPGTAASGGTAAGPQPYVGSTITICNHGTAAAALITIAGGDSFFQGSTNNNLVLTQGQSVTLQYGVDFLNSVLLWYVVGGTLGNEPVFNAILYGADPTGTNNSATAINTAITNAAAQGPGTKVFCPPGNYRLDTAIAIGNGNVGAYSTVNGVVLAGACPPPGEPWDLTTVTSGTKFTWHPNSGTDMITVAGPLRGFGIENLILDGQSNVNNGIHLTSASSGELKNIIIKSCKVAGFLMDSVNNASGGNTMHNNIDNLQVSIPAVAFAKGIVLTSNTANNNPCYNNFRNVEVLFHANTGNTDFGIYLGFSDNNTFQTVHFLGNTSAGTHNCLYLDYLTSSSRSLPADNTLWNVDFATTSSTFFANNGTCDTPGNVNRCYDISNCNGRPSDPAFAGLVYGLTSASPAP